MMSHIQVIIQLPLKYNSIDKETIRREVEPIKFKDTYDELFEISGGVNTSNVPVMGAWRNPKTGNKVDDECLVYNIVIECSDINNLKMNKKIQQLIEYKKKLKERFEQDEIYMLAIPCYWL